MLECAEKLPKEKFSYGLGIASVILQNGAFDVLEPYAYRWSGAPDGARVMRWNEAMKDEALSAKIFSLFLSQKKTMLSNYFFALSSALFSDGLIVAVDDGVSADIFLETALPASGADMLVICVGTRSKITIHEKFSSKNNGGMAGRTVLVGAGEDACVVYAESPLPSSQKLFFINKKAFAEDGARVSFIEAFEHRNGFLKSESAIFLGGKKSRADIITLMQTDEAAMCDTSASVFHEADGAVSDIFAVGTASGLSKIIYRGLINVSKGIHGGAGKQEGNFIIRSPHAEIDAIPSLEVASDDVKTSHSLSVRRLSEDSLFYPRTRGFPSRDAESIIIRGLMDHALAKAATSGHAEPFSSDLFFA